MTGVSVVIPVYNGGRHLAEVLEAILAQEHDGPLELVVVDDRSDDGSRAIVERYLGRGDVRLLEGEGRGPAAAINLGVRAARHPVLCQIDQDVVIQPGWLGRVVAALEAAPDIGAAQGRYVPEPGAGLWARVMALDLAQRYAAIRGDHVDHVCTGNTAYRAAALREVGLLDESFGYALDNDLSYRLVHAGWRLAFCREARAYHRWRASFCGYLAQQYGVGYGRLDLVAKHPRRFTGDQVSGVGMILHAAGTFAALAALGLAGLLAALDGPWALPAGVGAALLALLVVERGVAGAHAARRFGDGAGLLFVLAHPARDVIWAAAIAIWTLRRITRRRRAPDHSMKRAARAGPSGSGRPVAAPQVVPDAAEHGDEARAAAPPLAQGMGQVEGGD